MNTLLPQHIIQYFMYKYVYVHVYILYEYIITNILYTIVIRYEP